MLPTDTVAVDYRVLGVEPVRGAGRLEALAAIELDVAGVVIVLQGVQLRRRADGDFDCAAPAFRHPRTGQWFPAVILPPELRTALGKEVLATIRALPASPAPGATRAAA